MRAGGGWLTAVTVVMFALFHREYHGTYRIASARAYDPTAFREAATLIINSDQQQSAAAVYLPSGFYDAGAKWRFYTLKHQRATLWQRTTYFSDTASLAAAPVGNIAVVPHTDARFTPPPAWATIGIATTAIRPARSFAARPDTIRDRGGAASGEHCVERQERNAEA